MPLNGWNSDMSAAPSEEPYLVFLAEEACGTRVHVAINLKTANGHVLMVGGYFAYDMPQVLLWHEIVALPHPAKTS